MMDGPGSKPFMRVLAAFSLATVCAQGTGIGTVYIVPTSHLDIGFTAPASAVASRMRDAAARALALAEADPAYVWQFENFWQLEQWLHASPAPEHVAQLLGLLKSGRFGLSAAYATPHSGVMSDWALDWQFRLPADWARARGLHLRTAILDDVPGHAIDLPHFLAKNGVRYLLLGANLTFSKPLPAAIANTPFWWEAPSGERVLTWISCRSYTEAFMRLGIDPGAARLFNRKEFGGLRNMEVMEKGIQATLEFYRQRGYPYDAVVAMQAFDNWGSRNSAKIPRVAKLWNDAHETPKIMPSTADAFFAHIESKYGRKLPVRRGGFGGQWDSNRCGIPTAMRVARAAERAVRSQPQPDPDDIRRLLVFYEHSFGMGATWPRLMTRAQAVQHSREQYELLASLPGAKAAIEGATRAAKAIAHATVDTQPERKAQGVESDGLYLVRWNPMFIPPKRPAACRPMPAGAWMRRETQRLGAGGVRVRHWIDRRRLPDRAYVVWLWELAGKQANAPVRNRTATGWETIPDDRLAGYDWGGWTSPFGFRLGQWEFRGDGVLSFRRQTLGGRSWLLGLTLAQNLGTVFKDEGKGRLTFEEAYPGEAPIVEVNVTITKAGAESR